jgi:hypothetical protein
MGFDVLKELIKKNMTLCVVVSCSSVRRRTSNEIHGVVVQKIMLFVFKYCDVFAQSIVRQRLGKHIPTHRLPTIHGSNEYATIGCSLLGNVAVNTHAAVEGRCFLCCPCRAISRS